MIGALIPDEAALADLLSFGGGEVKFLAGSAEEFRAILLAYSDADQQSAALRDWLREKMQQAGDFSALTKDQAVFDALIDRRLKLARKVVADAEALKQALETHPPDMAEAGSRAAALLRPFVGDAKLIKTVEDMAQQLEGMAGTVSVQTDALALLRQLSPADAWPKDWEEVSDLRIEAFRNTLPKLDIKNPQLLSVYLADMALYLRLWQAGRVANVVEIAEQRAPGM